ncbi:MAG: FapA family protein [Phycisphaeraceae bacterium]
MVALVDKTGVAIRIEDDGSAATLLLGPRPPHQPVTPGQALEAMTAAGLAPLSHWAQALAQGVSRHRAAPDQRVAVQLTRLEPQAGQAGYVLWREGVDPTVARIIPGSPAEDERIDFYNQSRFVFVARGQMLGRVVDPVPGTPGTDVRGAVVAPADAEPAAVTIADGVAVDASGTMTAQVDGVLHFENVTVRVEPVLEIPGDVDFATGNVAFKGDVHVGGSVGDLFKVSSDQHVEVGGTIEAADVTTGGSLTVRGGIAGKEKGWLNIGGDLAARYLNGARGRVAGHVWVGREIDHTELEITGGLQAADGRIVGGSLTLGGDSSVGELGSPQGQATLIHLGFQPAMERQADRVLAIMARLRRRAKVRKKDLQRLSSGARGEANHPRAASLLREIEQLHARRRCWAEDLERRRLELARLANTELTVLRTLYPGVTIVTPKARATVAHEQAGPVMLGQTREGTVGIKRNGRSTYEHLASV